MNERNVKAGTGLIAAILSFVAVAIAVAYTIAQGGRWDTILVILLSGFVVAWLVLGAAITFAGAREGDWEQMLYGLIVVVAAVATPYLLFVGGMLQLASGVVRR